MSEEEKKDRTEDTQEEEETTTEETQEETTQDPDEPDWKAIAEKKAAQVENLNKALKQERSKNKGEDKVGQESEEESEEEDEIESKLEKVLQKREAKQAEGLIDRTLENLISDPNKRQLVKMAYKERINPSGFDPNSIADDIEAAEFLVDREAGNTKGMREGRKQYAQQYEARRHSGINPMSHEREDSRITDSDKAIAKSVGMDPKKYKEYSKTLDSLRNR